MKSPHSTKEDRDEVLSTVCKLDVCPKNRSWPMSSALRLLCRVHSRAMRLFGFSGRTWVDFEVAGVTGKLGNVVSWNAFGCSGTTGKSIVVLSSKVDPSSLVIKFSVTMKSGSASVKNVSVFVTADNNKLASFCAFSSSSREEILFSRSRICDFDDGLMMFSSCDITNQHNINLLLSSPSGILQCSFSLKHRLQLSPSRWHLIPN